MFRMFAHATAILLCLTSVLACASCASPTQPDGIAQLTTVLSRCADSRHSSLIASDESRTSRGATSQPVRLQVIRDEVARTAVCGGHVRVTVFSGSVVGQVVFDGDLTTVGATETSRLRKVPKLVDQTMATIGRSCRRRGRRCRVMAQISRGSTRWRRSTSRSRVLPDGRRGSSRC